MNSNPTAKALRSYFWHFGLSIIAYLITLIVIADYAHLNAMSKPWRILVALLPIIPMIFAFAAFIRFVRATDELKRLIIIHSLAIASGVYIFFTATCELLAIAGISKPSAFCAYGVFMASWAIASVLLHHHYYYRGR